MFLEPPPPRFVVLLMTLIRESVSASAETISKVLSSEQSLTIMISISFNVCDKTVLNVSEIYPAALCTGIITETAILSFSDMQSP
uniref:Uncharacterized protein n=1 Tax=Escherichia coli TaxID=562 RepID=A0A2H5BZV2_ECOLX|nr:hypothetical protein PCOV6_00185 [Escherichia coli]